MKGLSTDAVSSVYVCVLVCSREFSLVRLLEVMALQDFQSRLYHAYPRNVLTIASPAACLAWARRAAGVG